MGDRLRDHLLHFTTAIHLGRVDVGEPQVQAAPERRDRFARVVLLQVPRSLPDARDQRLERTKPLAHPL